MANTSEQRRAYAKRATPIHFSRQHQCLYATRTTNGGGAR